MRNSLFVAFVATLLFVQPSAEAARQTAASPTIIAAERSKAFVSPTRQIRPRNDMEDVVLVLRVALSRADFQKIDRAKVYVMSGDKNFPPNIVGTGVIDGKEEVLLVSVVPRAMLDMTLFIGDYQPVAFKAEETVEDVLPEGAPAPIDAPAPSIQPPPATTSPR